jgi:hypothetical protein
MPATIASNSVKVGIVSDRREIPNATKKYP